jgi:hypothetical protein
MPSKGKATRVGVVVGVVRAGRVDPALFIAGDSPANRNLLREPTSGLEPLTCSLRVIINRCRGLHRITNPAYLSRFLFSGLPGVARYCVTGGVRVVSTPSLYPPGKLGCLYSPVAQRNRPKSS